jgi:hypothetical protein
MTWKINEPLFFYFFVNGKLTHGRRYLRYLSLIQDPTNKNQ